MFPNDGKLKLHSSHGHHVYSDSERVFLCRFSSRLSRHDYEKYIRDFLRNPQYDIFLLVCRIELGSKKMYQYVNHLRIMIEQMENEEAAEKLFVVLLLLPSAQLFSSSYPCLFLRGWDHYYLDSISPSMTTYKETSKLQINEWFSQLCLPVSGTCAPSQDSLLLYLNDLLWDIIPIVVARINFGSNEGTSINGVIPVFCRIQLIEQLFKKTAFGGILCIRFRDCWNAETMSKYVHMAAHHIYLHNSTLSLAGQMQVILHFLFAHFVIQILNEVNMNGGLDMLFSYNSELDKLCLHPLDTDSECLLSLFAEMVYSVPLPDLTSIGLVFHEDDVSPRHLQSLDQHQCMFPMSHVVFQILKTVVDHSRQLLLFENQSARISLSEQMIIDKAKLEWEQSLKVNLVCICNLVLNTKCSILALSSGHSQLSVLHIESKKAWCMLPCDSHCKCIKID